MHRLVVRCSIAGVSQRSEDGLIKEVGGSDAEGGGVMQSFAAKTPSAGSAPQRHHLMDLHLHLHLQWINRDLCAKYAGNILWSIHIDTKELRGSIETHQIMVYTSQSQMLPQRLCQFAKCMQVSNKSTLSISQHKLPSQMPLPRPSGWKKPKSRDPALVN